MLIVKWLFERNSLSIKATDLNSAGGHRRGHHQDDDEREKSEEPNVDFTVMQHFLVCCVHNRILGDEGGRVVSCDLAPRTTAHVRLALDVHVCLPFHHIQFH